MNNNIIGIDISKHFFDICILPCKKFTRFPNNIDGFKDFLLLLEKSKFDKILMEDTGCYHGIAKSSYIIKYPYIQKGLERLLTSLQI